MRTLSAFALLLALSWTGSAVATQRVVLAEEFTGTW